MNTKGKRLGKSSVREPWKEISWFHVCPPSIPNMLLVGYCQMLADDEETPGYQPCWCKVDIRYLPNISKQNQQENWAARRTGRGTLSLSHFSCSSEHPRKHINMWWKEFLQSAPLQLGALNVCTHQTPYHGPKPELGLVPLVVSPANPQRMTRQCSGLNKMELIIPAKLPLQK